MKLKSDEKLNPAASEVAQGFRQLLIKEAEKEPLTKKFKVTPHALRPSMVITYKRTGRSAEVALGVYKDARRLLNALFG